MISVTLLSYKLVVKVLDWGLKDWWFKSKCCQNTRVFWNFPEFSVFRVSRSPSAQLQKTIEAELRQSGLQVTPFTVTKVIQLYETKNSRHSTMIVGKTGSGKTVTWRTLQSTLTTMHRKGDPSFNVVRVSPSVLPS